MKMEFVNPLTFPNLKVCVDIADPPSLLCALPAGKEFLHRGKLPPTFRKGNMRGICECV